MKTSEKEKTKENQLDGTSEADTSDNRGEQTEPSAEKPKTETEVNPKVQEEETSSAAATQIEQYEKSIRKFLNLQDGEEIGDLDARLSAYAEQQDKAIKAANDNLITASIYQLQGYDTKLLAKLIDRSGITVSPDGTVVGLTEAVKAVETEFPAVVITKQEQKKPFVPINSADNQPTAKTMNDLIRRRF